jgi:hypothetical protein
MTGTEERLRDALRASAARVRDDRLRSFPDLDPTLPRGAGRRSPGWRLRLIPVAAAASVVLVIGLVMAVTGGPAHRAAAVPAAARPGSATAGFPKYFADVTSPKFAASVIRVRSSSTGAVVASVPSPEVRNWLVEFNSVAAAPDGRTFYVEFDALHAMVQQVWVYRLTIPNGTTTARLVRIDGGVISGAAILDSGPNMAVSPGGTELALITDAAEQLNNNTGGHADAIIVINLLTGTRSVWQGGLGGADKTFTIPDISWTTDGRSLVFLGQWCKFPAASRLCSGPSGSQGYRETQVRSLSVAAGGGALNQGSVLLTQSARYPVIAAAVAGPAPSELSVIVLSGRPGAGGTWSKIAVERVADGSGALLGVDYRANTIGDEGQTGNVSISADPSGRYLLLSYSGPGGYNGPAGYTGQGGFYTGWIGQGKLHFLPIEQPYSGWWISAW